MSRRPSNRPPIPRKAPPPRPTRAGRAASPNRPPSQPLHRNTVRRGRR